MKVKRRNLLIVTLIVTVVVLLIIYKPRSRSGREHFGHHHQLKDNPEDLDLIDSLKLVNKTLRKKQQSKGSSYKPKLFPPPSSHFAEFVDSAVLDSIPRRFGKVRTPAGLARHSLHFGYMNQDAPRMIHRSMQRSRTTVKIAVDESLKDVFTFLSDHLQQPKAADQAYCPIMPECEFYFSNDYAAIAEVADALITDKPKGILVNNAALHFTKAVHLPFPHQPLEKYDWSGTDWLLSHRKPVASALESMNYPLYMKSFAYDETFSSLSSSVKLSAKLNYVAFAIPQSACLLRQGASDSLIHAILDFANALEESDLPVVYLTPDRASSLADSCEVIFNTPFSTGIDKEYEDTIKAGCKGLEGLALSSCLIKQSKGAIVLEPFIENGLYSQQFWEAVGSGSFTVYLGPKSFKADFVNTLINSTTLLDRKEFVADPEGAAATAVKTLRPFTTGKMNKTEHSSFFKWKKKELHSDLVNTAPFNRNLLPCRFCKQVKAKKAAVQCLLDTIMNKGTFGRPLSSQELTEEGIVQLADNSPPASKLGALSEHLNEVFILHQSFSISRRKNVIKFLKDLGVEGKIVADFDMADDIVQEDSCVDWTKFGIIPSPYDEEMVLSTEIDHEISGITGRRRGAGSEWYKVALGWYDPHPPSDLDKSMLLKTYAAFVYMLASNASAALVLEDDVTFAKGMHSSILADVFKTLPENYPLVLLGPSKSDYSSSKGQLSALGKNFISSELLFLGEDVEGYSESEQLSSGLRLQEWDDLGGLVLIQNRWTPRLSNSFAVSKAGAILSFKGFPIRWPADLQLGSIVLEGNRDLGGMKHPDWNVYHVTPRLFDSMTKGVKNKSS